MHKSIILARIITFILCLTFTHTAFACTLFASNGDKTVDGGSLIVKNRDEKATSQRLIWDTKGKYNFYGLYAISGKHWSLKGGVNEKGVAVFSASASAIPKKIKETIKTTNPAPTRKILSECASVEEALTKNEYFKHPQFLMIADKDEIAYVEIGLKGYKTKRVKNDTLAHTNHFLESDMLENNIKIATSSNMRYKRIKELLNLKSKHTLDDFIKYSEDKSAGANNSIWRVGTSPKSTQTLAVMAVHIKENSTDVYVKIRKHPNDKGKEEIIKIINLRSH